MANPRWCWGWLAVGALLWSAPVQAQSTVPAGGFALDLFQGPVLAPSRVLSLGGAYAGLAEGTVGMVANAASVAVRAPHSVSWLQLNGGASLAIPGLFDDNDFDNSGDDGAEQRSFVYLSAEIQMQVGVFGAGISTDFQRHIVAFPDSDEEAVVVVGRYRALFGVGLLDGQLAIGGGIRAITLGLSTPDAELTMAGAGPQLGVLVRPNWMPFRIGLSYRHQVVANTTLGSGGEVGRDGIIRAGRLQLPRRVEQPWELEFGVAVQVGPRPLNPLWINPHDHADQLREGYRRRRAARTRARAKRLARITDPMLRRRANRREGLTEATRVRREEQQLREELARLKQERAARAANWPRESLLLSTELLVTGAVADAIGVQRFLSQGQPLAAGCQAVGSGADVNFSPRAGVEVEPLPGWLRTRLGSYYEPNRFTYEPSSCAQHVGRQHFTFGGDLKLFTTDLFGLLPEASYMLQAHADIAPRYQNVGLSIAIWR